MLCVVPIFLIPVKRKSNNSLIMEYWNSRRMLAPPTYTYEAKADDIDINHFKTILQDGIKFFNEQNILNIESALLTRIVYRMKTKFRNSKDFQMLEKVKKNVLIFQEMDISKKLDYLLSILPDYDYQQVLVSLPTKNMVDYILVQLQGVGKILCKAIETCKLTFIIYEHRLYLGHFWKLALIAISLVSRIHILCLNIVKFTCLLYLRLLPYAHKLKNVTTNWLPKEYVFPKDLQNWLNVEWSKLAEVIVIPDQDFNLNLIDLAGDSDDDVEYIEITDDSKIIEDFRKILKTRVVKQDFDEPNKTYEPNDIDVGEEIEDEEVRIDDQNEMLQEVDEIPSSEKEQDDDFIEEVDIGEEISSDDEPLVTSTGSTQNKINEMDVGEIILSDEEIVENPPIISFPKIKRRNVDEVVISLSDDEIEDSSVQFIADTRNSKKSFVTTDFIPLGESTPFIRNKKKSRKKINRVDKILGSSKNLVSKTGMKNIKNESIVVIAESPSRSTLSKKKCKKPKVNKTERKRKLSTEGRTAGPSKKKRKQTNKC